MSQQLFTAPAGHGKTTYAVELARQTARALPAEVRVCVPTGLQARAWRHHLAQAGGAMGVHVLTFDRLAAACLNAANDAYTQLSEPIQYRLLRTTIGLLPLQHYAPLKEKPGFIQESSRLIAEFKATLVDPATLAGAVTALGNDPRLSELAGIYAAYQDRLQEQGWADRVGLHWLAVEALVRRAPQACRDWPLLIVDGFDDFTPAQLALITLLSERVGRLVLMLPLAEHVAFPRYQATRQAVERALSISAQPLPQLARPATIHPTLQYLASRLFTRVATEPVPADGALRLSEAPDRAGEVRVALRWLKQQIVWHGHSPDRLLLSARDITPYRAFIQQVAAEFGLPVQMVSGAPLLQNPAIKALLELLRLHLPLSPSAGPILPRRQLITTWRSPYFAWTGDVNAIAPVDADNLDRLARRHRVIRGLAQWQAAFAAASPVGPDADPDDAYVGDSQELAGALVLDLQQKFTRFLAQTRPPTGSTTMRAFVRWLEELIGPDPALSGSTPPPSGSLQIVAQVRSNPATAAADLAALRALKGILHGLVWSDAAGQETAQLDFPAFFSELGGAISATTYQLPPRAGQAEIICADLIQVRGLRFAAVALMGLSEGSFPATISEDPFLRDADRAALSPHLAFPLSPSTLSAEQEFFYEAVTRAEQKLLLTRPVLADNGAEWLPSPFWEAARRLVAAPLEAIPSEQLVPLADTASVAEWWETVAALPGGASWAEQRNLATWRRIESAARIWRLREAGEASEWDGDLTFLQPAFSAHFGPDFVWSASRLESYQTCGYLYHLQYLLQLTPRPEPAEGLDGRQLGAIYHRVLEQVTKSIPSPEFWEEETLRARVAAIAAPILAAAPEREGFRETPWWMQTRQEIQENVLQTLRELAQDDYVFLRAEASFGRNSPPLSVPDGDDQLQLRGVIDRVDRRPDGQIRIIDYKSGNKAPFTSAAFERGQKLQLPLYALAAQQTLALGEVVDGFYWHFQQAESSSFTLGKAEGAVAGAVETALAHAWQAVRAIRHGRFVPRPPAEGCPTYCPAAGFCWRYTPKRY